MRNIAWLVFGMVLLIGTAPSFAQLQQQAPGLSANEGQTKSDSKQIKENDRRQVPGIPSYPPKAENLSQSLKSSSQVNPGNWLKSNALALVALIVAILGGLPGLLKIIEHFRPISLKGSIKFYAPTSGDNPPFEGILVALTLINQGSKELIWRKITANLEIKGNRVSLQPSLITPAQAFNNVRPWENDLLKQQVITPGVPINGYLHFLAPKGSIGTGFVSPSRLFLQFETEAGRSARATLHFVGNHPLGENESFPTHGVTF